MFTQNVQGCGGSKSGAILPAAETAVKLEEYATRPSTASAKGTVIFCWFMFFAGIRKMCQGTAEATSTNLSLLVGGFSPNLFLSAQPSLVSFIFVYPC